MTRKPCAFLVEAQSFQSLNCSSQLDKHYWFLDYRRPHRHKSDPRIFTSGNLEGVKWLNVAAFSISFWHVTHLLAPLQLSATYMVKYWLNNRCVWPFWRLQTLLRGFMFLFPLGWEFTLLLSMRGSPEQKIYRQYYIPTCEGHPLYQEEGKALRMTIMKVRGYFSKQLIHSDEQSGHCMTWLNHVKHGR